MKIRDRHRKNEEGTTEDGAVTLCIGSENHFYIH